MYIFCYPALTEEEANEMREFLRLLNCVSLTESVLDHAAQIRRDYRLKLADGAACRIWQDTPTPPIEIFKLCLS